LSPDNPPFLQRDPQRAKRVVKPGFDGALRDLFVLRNIGHGLAEIVGADDRGAVVFTEGQIASGDGRSGTMSVRNSRV
jgi:hypothetical protein